MKPLLTFLGIVGCCALYAWGAGWTTIPGSHATLPTQALIANAAAVLILCAAAALYCLPLIIALARQHRQGGAISLLNLLLGWTLLGWVGALIWAVSASPTDAVAP
jgi:hypothetical protein